MDQLDVALLISRWLHIASAIVAIGGVAFSLIALLPAARETLDDASHERLREALRRRWARVVHVSIVLLLVTGGLNFVWLALPPKIEPMPYHAIFGVKFLAAMGVFFLASVLVGRSPGFAEMRKGRAKWLAVILALAAVIVLVSGVLSQVRLGRPAASSPVTAAPE
jgi:uncharacterized membrane protein